MHAFFKLLICLIALSLGVFSLPASAQTIKSNTPRFQLRQIRQDASGQRCKIVESNISTQLIRFNNNKERYLGVYHNVQQKLQWFIQQTAAQKVDASKITSDITTLNTMIEKFQSDYTDYASSLTAASQYACGKSNGEFVSQLQTARRMLAIVHADSVAIRSFYQTALRSNILSLRSALKSIVTPSPTI